MDDGTRVPPDEQETFPHRNRAKPACASLGNLSDAGD